MKKGEILAQISQGTNAFRLLGTDFEGKVVHSTDISTDKKPFWAHLILMHLTDDLELL